MKISSEEIIDNWVAETKGNDDKLKAVVIATGRIKEIVVSRNWLKNHFGISLSSSMTHAEKIDTIIDEMVARGYINKSYSATENNISNIIKNWFDGLNSDEKKLIPTFGNKISIRHCLENVYPGISAAIARYELVRITCDKINLQLISDGVLSNEYKDVKTRSELRDKEYIKKRGLLSKGWDDLVMLPLDKIQDLKQVSAGHFIQVRQLFASRARQESQKSTVGNYKIGLKHFLQYLNSIGYEGSVTLMKILDRYTLVNFNNRYVQPLVKSGKFSPSHATSVLSSVRQTLLRAMEIEGLNYEGFYETSSYGNKRSTLVKAPFTDKEKSDIDYAISEELSAIRAIINTPYQKQNRGSNPFDEFGGMKVGFGTEENARWYFENILNCCVVTYADADKNKPEVGKFLKILSDSEIGLHSTYRKWGVISQVDMDILVPFILRLAQVTGINVESILTLDIDCFSKKHPVTGRPNLKFWKSRSSGEKEYNLDLFQADLRWLSVAQSQEVSRIFDDVVRLTQAIRIKAPEKFCKRLFIYQSVGRRTFGDVRPIWGDSLNTSIYSAIKNFRERNNLKNCEGSDITLNMGRFRPSFISDLIKEGVSMREIQHILGHQNLETTIGYLDRNDFNLVSRKNVQDKLEAIHSSATAKVESSNQENISYVPDLPVIKTSLSGCKNIFNPPPFIRAIKGYVEGTPCSQFNKCLSCDNVIITKKDLPELFALERSYKSTIAQVGSDQTPYYSVIIENLSLVQKIIDPDTSDFSPFELDEAERISLHLELSSDLNEIGL